MTDEIVLSVVIPCRNAERVLGTQLQAVVGQCDETTEVIVVDNGSSDGTAVVARSYRGVRVVDAPTPAGRHHACNVGANAARGRFILFLDADDEAASGYLSTMRDALVEHDYVFGRLAPWHGTSGFGALAEDATLVGADFMPFASGGAQGIHADVFASVGGFDETMDLAEDTDLSWRLTRAGHPPTPVADAEVRVRPRPNARSMFRQHRGYGRGQVRLYVKWRSQGMQRRTVRQALRELVTITKSLPYLGSRDVRDRWARRTGRMVGRLQQSIIMRVWFV